MDLPKNHYIAIFEAAGSRFSRTKGEDEHTLPLKVKSMDPVICFDASTGMYDTTAKKFVEVV